MGYEKLHCHDLAIHYMIPEIREAFLDMVIAQDIWGTVANTYSWKGNSAQIFEWRWLIGRFEQGEQHVLQYFKSFSTSWKHLDHLLDYKPVCPSDSAAYSQLVAEERLFKFLESFLTDYDPVCSHVLGMEPLPSLQYTMRKVVVPQCFHPFPLSV